jgi:23S rRNA (cytosine1962-C5)-methyltransferase
MKAAVYLHQAREAALRRGHPWVFPKAIARQTGKPVIGELIDVFSADEKLLGVGVFNEHSLYRVRVLAQAFEQIDMASIASIVSHRLHQASLLRKSIHLPSAVTSAYRLFNSEGDGLSGLTIDCFNQSYVVASSAYWVEAHKDVICQAIREVMSTDNIIWLAQPKPLAQDGWEQVGNPEKMGTEQVLEAGVRFEVDFSNTQKTGLFLDQRENHQRIATLAAGKRVLDLYTYTGGFALHAAKAGAAQVTAVDSSAQAITLAKRNATLNNLDSIEFIEADARDYLAKAGDYDLVILDPPKLVPSQRHLERAKNYYRFLHRETFKYMQSGSLLLTCNCSSALSAQQFTELVSIQAIATGKVVRILGVFGPSSCHPMLAAFPEGHYLTAVLLAIV